MISNEDKERVRRETDVLALVGETVELRQRGNTWWGCCPFHNEKSPSFHVDPRTGLWKCFGCGESGDVFAYVMKRESLEFTDAIRYLADRAGIELTEEANVPRGPRRNRLVEALAEAESFYCTMLMRGRSAGAAEARRYLAGRDFGAAVCRDWCLGYAPGRSSLVTHLRSRGFTVAEMLAADLAVKGRGGPRDRFFDRVMFPIHDRLGRPVGFGGRVMGDGKPKYLNTKETPVFHKSKELFAFDRAKEGMVATGDAIVCEGYTDVIAMHRAGFTNTVAALGTSFSADHVRTISGLAKAHIICMFDGDEAGQRAAERAVQYIDKTRLEMLCVILPDGQDPAEYLSDHGADAMRDRLAEARPLMDFVFDKRLQGFNLKIPGQRVAALDSLAEVLASLEGSVLLGQYVTSVALMLGASDAEVRRVVEQKAAQRRRYDERSSAVTPTPVAPVRSYPPPEESLSVLSADERFQARAERELLALMAANPEPVRALGDRVAQITWSDPRNEMMAWAMLSAPDDATGADLVDAATRVVPDAAVLLSGGEVTLFAELSDEDKAHFLVDLVEMASCRREIASEQARLRMSGGGEDAAEIGRRVMELQRRIVQLSKELPSAV